MFKNGIPPMYGWSQGSAATQIFQPSGGEDDGTFEYTNNNSSSAPSSSQNYNTDEDDTTVAWARVARGEDSAIWYKAYFRFPNISVAQGATIQNSYLKVIISLASGTGAATIVGTDVDNVTQPVNGSDGVHSLHTTASVAWSNPTANGTNYVSSPDIATIIQEIVDRPGWSSGNAIMIQIFYQGSVTGDQNRKFLAWDANDNASQAAKLEIST